MYELIFISSVCVRYGQQESCTQESNNEYHAALSVCQDRIHALWSETLVRGARLTYSGCMKAGDQLQGKLISIISNIEIILLD